MLTLSFTRFPTLRTERLLLREITPDDAAALFSMRSDPLTMRYIGKPPQKDIHEASALIESIRHMFAQNEAVTWAVCLSENPALLVGTIGFWRMDKPNHRCEIGYMLNADYWRRGIMDEAMGAVLEYAFKVLDFHSIEANTDPENEASGRILEKHGFVQEAYFRENFYVEGKFLDSRIYSRINPWH